MDTPVQLGEFEHPAWRNGLATVAGYALLLLVVFGVLFVLPWLALGGL